jgi:hypothetical protein
MTIKNFKMNKEGKNNPKRVIIWKNKNKELKRRNINDNEEK